MNNPTPTTEPKRRLEKIHWKILSILGVFGILSLLLYTILERFWIIPITTVIVFLILWRKAWPWNLLEEVFSNRPTTKWGKLSLSLVLAILAASVFEDVFEIFRRVMYFIFRLIFR